MSQFDLFGAHESAAAPQLPDGFRYARDVIAHAEEAVLIEAVRTLPFAPFEFHGYTGRRRTVSFGHHYDFATEQLREANAMPAFLRALRAVVAQFAERDASTFTQVLVTEYEAGAGIGWHRDKGVFEEIAGVSLLAPCTFRLRRARVTGAGWDRVNLTAEPRSAYLLSGASRTEWEHSIPPVDALRYSITFRSLRARR